MTENEAIEKLNGKIAILKRKTSNFLDVPCGELRDAAESIKLFKFLVKSLKRLKKYRTISTVAECQEAMEKQKAKEPYIYGDGYSHGNPIYDMYECPNCGETYEIEVDKYDYCPKCGRRMNRSDLE